MKRYIAMVSAFLLIIILGACGQSLSITETASGNDASKNKPLESISCISPIESEPNTSSFQSGSLDVKESGPFSESNTNDNKEAESISITSITSQSSLTLQPPSVPQPTSEAPVKEGEKNNAMPNISITVGDSVFSAKLYDNSAASALLERFPMTLNMSELNGNEKYYYLPDNLPTDSQRVGNIKNGDLMLYGSDCLVLFYESFSTSYSYTKLGYIEDASGLAAALGGGSVEVAFAVGN